jgi:alkylhydroperoxidase family enzyme
VDHALKLTRSPATMTEADVDRLRAHDLDDRAILDLTLVTAYFAFVNRIASGLGVEVEPGGPPHPSHD